MMMISLQNQTKVKDIGEQGLLKLIQKFCFSGIGDDGAISLVRGDQALITTTDVLVDRVHFSDQTTPPHAVGYRAIVANLSDLCAMGATPLGVTVGLSLPPDLLVDWVLDCYQGMSDCLHRYGGVILGGDIVRSNTLSLAITALGQVSSTRLICRNQAKIGDKIVITGYHGLSRAGLELLLNKSDKITLENETQAKFIQSHQYPQPRFDILTHLPDIPIAGMDSSDGLADAIIQLCTSSKTGAIIDYLQLPLHPDLCQWVGAEKALEWTLYGGEDFELVLTLPPSYANILCNHSELKCWSIGEIVNPEKNIKIINLPHHSQKILSLQKGFQHF